MLTLPPGNDLPQKYYVTDVRKHCTSWHWVPSMQAYIPDHEVPPGTKVYLANLASPEGEVWNEVECYVDFFDQDSWRYALTIPASSQYPAGVEVVCAADNITLGDTTLPLPGYTIRENEQKPYLSSKTYTPKKKPRTRDYSGDSPKANVGTRSTFLDELELPDTITREASVLAARMTIPAIPPSMPTAPLAMYTRSTMPPQLTQPHLTQPRLSMPLLGNMAFSPLQDQFHPRATLEQPRQSTVVPIPSTLPPPRNSTESGDPNARYTSTGLRILAEYPADQRGEHDGSHYYASGYAPWMTTANSEESPEAAAEVAAQTRPGQDLWKAARAKIQSARAFEINQDIRE